MGFDEDLFSTLNHALSGPLTTHFFSLITYAGDGLLLALIILPLLYFFDRTRFRQQTLAMVLSVAMSGLTVNLMKIAVGRPRPPEHFASSDVEVHTPLGTPSDRSFPSGHTQTAFGAATYLSCLYPIWAPAFVVFAALVGLSRIAVGVHFPLDVLIGAAIGALFSLVGFWVNKKYLLKNLL
ncbi:MAG: phosphatase PAP2 family protein [Proteobacteria bacterium]|nr:phosphatase PAP2 family protein [Pseudomonadota bacterium]